MPVPGFVSARRALQPPREDHPPGGGHHGTAGRALRGGGRWPAAGVANGIVWKARHLRGHTEGLPDLTFRN